MHWSHERGLAAEEKVLAELERQGYEHLRSRCRTPFAEIDLLMKKGPQYALVEVKSISARGFVEARLSKRQKERLRHAQMWLQAQTEAEVELLLAWVEESGQILLFNLEEDDLK